MRVLKDFKGCVLGAAQLHIPKELWARFSELRILKELRDRKRRGGERRKRRDAASPHGFYKDATEKELEGGAAKDVIP